MSWILPGLLFTLMPVSIVLAFMWAEPAQILGESSRILYFHVPLAVNSAIAFVAAGAYSVYYLARHKKQNMSYEEAALLEAKAHNSASLGIVFTVLTIITGSVWARTAWGVYWNWDPRETSIVILLLVYIAYFSLRVALQNNPNRGRLSAVYLIIAMAISPFFIFVVPRIYDSLHPNTIINSDSQIHLEYSMRITLLLSCVSFILLYMNIFSLANRVNRLQILFEDNYEN